MIKKKKTSKQIPIEYCSPCVNDTPSAHRIPSAYLLVLGFFKDDSEFDISIQVVRTIRSTDRANPYRLIPSGRRPRVGVWPSRLQKDGQRICILKVHCLGG